MDTFLVDDSDIYSYDLLLSQIKTCKDYIPVLRTHSLYDYFFNLLTALAFNESLVLIDSDMSEQEINSLAVGEINKPRSIKEASAWNNWETFRDTVLSSSSEITIFTSGTTGQPKKVVHTIGTLTRSVRRSDKHIEDIWLFAYNPTHMAGLQVFFQAFANKNALVNSFNQPRKTVFELIQRYHITHISATPTFYRLLLPADQSFCSVRRITLGGEKSNTSLYENILKLFPAAKLTNIYASTEAGSLFVAKGENFQIPDSIVDKCKISPEGELLVHKSLLGKSDSFIYQNDYYHTGDIVEWVDESKGLFRFVSRKNELINVGGYKVNPNEVEEAICNIEGVEQAYVYGKTNSILGNMLFAEVVKQPGYVLSELDIRKKLSIHLQDFKIPRKVIFVEHLSLTRTGKLKRV